MTYLDPHNDDNAPATKGDLRLFSEELTASTKNGLQEQKSELLEEIDKRIEAHSPATKTDIQMLMDEIGKLYIANERWKDDVLDKIDEKLDLRFATWEKRLIDQFGVIAENLYYDYFGVEKDRVKDHEKRIVVLERRAGVRP